MASPKRNKTKSRARATNSPSRSTRSSSTTIKRAATKSSDKIKKKYDSSSRNEERLLDRTHSKRNYSGSLYNRKTARKETIDKNKISASAIIVLLIIVIASFITMGWELTIFVILGLGIILGISYFTNSLMKKRWAKRTINVLVVLFLLLIFALTAGAAFFAYKVVADAPEFNEEKLNRKESTLIYDNQNQLIVELGTEKREIIKYEELSEELINAVIATEDSRFFQHQGFDAARFLKATLGQIQGKDNAGGGSTISMQVIKNSFTSVESKGFQGIKRKFTDIYLSIFKLEKSYTKQEIIEFYVNNHFLGSNSYGVEQASLTYFGKKASELTLPEAAIIAGMFQAPSSYNPFNNPENTTKRRAEVLSLMRRHGYITKDEEELANAVPVQSLLVNKTGEEVEFGAYIDTVIEELEDKDIYPYKEPLLIYTNMNREKQSRLDDIFSGKTFDWVYPEVQSGIAAVEVSSGKIIAVGAGRNRNDARTYNYATMIRRQIGSVAKPLFDYGPGIEYNNWSTYTPFIDEPHSYSTGQAIRNSDGAFMGFMTLRRALALSRNIPALKAFQQVDNKKVLEFVQNLGIKPEVLNGSLHEAHSLGAFNGASPLEMAAAYAAFANGGTYYKPYSVNKIVYRETNEIVDFAPTGVKVMSDSTAFMITDVLKTSVLSGLASGARINGINIAAKTGTTNFPKDILRKYGLPNSTAHDAWVVGYDPEYAIGMWYGYPKIDSKHYMTTYQSGPQRGRVFRAAGAAIFDRTGKDFAVPNSVVRLPIELGTNPGALASGGTPSGQVVYEYFKKGTEPTETSAKYNKLANVTGLTANHDSGSKTTFITWNAVATPDEANPEYGKFGYKVYKDGKFIGFTSDNSFTIRNHDNPSGTYRVVTSYEIYSANASSGVSVGIDTVDVKIKSSAKHKFNSSDASYNFADDVIAIRDGKEIKTTSNVKVVDPLTNNNISWATAVNVPGAYIINYSVYNEGKQIATLSREVEVN